MDGVTSCSVGHSTRVLTMSDQVTRVITRSPEYDTCIRSSLPTSAPVLSVHVTMSAIFARHGSVTLAPISTITIGLQMEISGIPRSLHRLASQATTLTSVTADTCCLPAIARHSYLPASLAEIHGNRNLATVSPSEVDPTSTRSSSAS